MKDGAMFIDYFSIDFSCFVPQGEWNRWNTRNKIGQLFSGHTPNRMRSNGLSCSTCSACFTHSAERNKMPESGPILFRYCIDLYLLYRVPGVSFSPNMLQIDILWMKLVLFNRLIYVYILMTFPNNS